MLCCWDPEYPFPAKWREDDQREPDTKPLIPEVQLPRLPWASGTSSEDIPYHLKEWTLCIVLKNVDNPSLNAAARASLGKVCNLTDKLKEFCKCLPGTRSEREAFAKSIRASIPPNELLAAGGAPSGGAPAPSSGSFRKFTKMATSISTELDFVTEKTWATLVKGTLLKRLHKFKLETEGYLSRDEDQIFILVRAPNASLEREAQRIKCKVKFDEAVDPGLKFWEVDSNVRQDQENYTKKQANAILQDMARRFPEFPDRECQVFKDENEEMYSHRIHIWRRAFGKDPRTQIQWKSRSEPGCWWRWKSEQEFNEDFEASLAAPDSAPPKIDAKTITQLKKTPWECGIKNGKWVNLADEQKVCRNMYPVYSPFEVEPHHRHLFQRSEVRSNAGSGRPRQDQSGQTPKFFVDSEIIEVTRSLVDQALDLGLMAEKGFLDSGDGGGFLCLHNTLPTTSRECPDELAKLRLCWVTWWRCSYSDHASDRWGTNRVRTSDQLHAAPRGWLRPLCQPLSEIQDYFGSKIALYFAWLGVRHRVIPIHSPLTHACRNSPQNYTLWLMFPAALGLALSLATAVKGPEWVGNSTPGFQVGGQIQAAFSGCVVLWAVLFNKFWLREEKVCALMWGTLGVEGDEPARPQFQGEMRRSPITDRDERYLLPRLARRKLHPRYPLIHDLQVLLHHAAQALHVRQLPDHGLRHRGAAPHLRPHVHAQSPVDRQGIGRLQTVGRAGRERDAGKRVTQCIPINH
jgi:hypothetical protein